MLSGEGNENAENTLIGLINKKATLHEQHIFSTFLCRCLARLQRKTSRNFLQCSYTFYGGNVECSPCSCSLFFSLPLIFTLVADSISHFLTGATKFSRCSYNKKMSPCFFFSRTSFLSLFFSLSFACLSPTFSFSLSFSFSTFPYLWT